MLSIQQQCALVGLSRSAYYYTPATETAENLQLMRLLDAQYLVTPFYGSRRMTVWLNQQGYGINRKRIQRLMRLMGLEGLAPGPQTSVAHPAHPHYPYLLRDVAVVRPNQAWCVDITYVPMAIGFMYLVAIMDWFSRYVVGWAVSNSLDTDFCLDALDQAFAYGAPDIFNSDQGVQFTSPTWIARVEQAGSRVSMDGRGRVFDNIFIERLWRSVKYEDIYLRDYATGPELIRGLATYFTFYNEQRPHQAHAYHTPAEIYQQRY
jgi:putative transposase